MRASLRASSNGPNWGTARRRARALVGILAWVGGFGLTLGCSDDDGADETGTTGEPEPSAEARWCAHADIDEVEARVDALLAATSPEEKARLMAGNVLNPSDGVYRTPGLPEFGLPGLAMIDGPRGVSDSTGPGTAFPVGAARGASWDPELERRVGEAIGLETRAKGAGVLLAPTVNVLRHPRWGRAQETYGEEPFHIARMGGAFVEGAQRHVMASVKHLAANSIEDTRFEVDVQVDERALREVYLEPFRYIVREAGVASVMSAYNLVNGQYCGENQHLLRDILKGDWAFLGFVESDWVFGTRSTLPSLAAGLDLEMPTANYYGVALRDALATGEASVADVDEAVARIARAQWCWAMDVNPPTLDPSVVESPAHSDLAKSVAERSITLLRNLDGALPIERSEVTRIALLGDLLDVENIGDGGSSAVAPSSVVTPLEGLTAAAQGVELVTVAWPLDDAGVAALQSADVAVVVTGLTDQDEGESLIAAGDRETLSLRATQIDRITGVAALHPRVVVVLEGGSSLVVDPWIEEVEALVMAWYPGMRGGDALAAVLFGDVDAQGRTPVSWPRAESDLPVFDNESTQVTYDLWHGYRHLERSGATARFAFGSGESYTDFDLEVGSVVGLDADGGIVDDAQLPTAQRFRVGVVVENVGARAGRAVPQLYVGPLDSGVERPAYELEAFASVDLDAGERVEVELEFSREQLQVWGEGGWRVESGEYELFVGRDVNDRDQRRRFSVNAP